MKPLSEYRAEVARMTVKEFAVAYPHPFLILSVTKALSPIDHTRGLTIDRLIVPGSDDARPATALDDYVVAAVKPLETSRAKEITVGCSSHCDVRINDASVSKLHAYLVDKADGWHVTDASSVMGTRVNDEESSSAPLQPGDRISIGLIDVVFLMPAELHSLVQQLAKTSVAKQTPA
jgi:hypothetical protein